MMDLGIVQVSAGRGCLRKPGRGVVSIWVVTFGCGCELITWRDDGRIEGRIRCATAGIHD